VAMEYWLPCRGPTEESSGFFQVSSPRAASGTSESATRLRADCNLISGREIETAFMAPETVFRFRAGSLGERRLHFAIYPTTRALKSPFDLSLEARKALLQHGRGMEVRLYLGFTRSYLAKFVFQIHGALLGVAADLRDKPPNFPPVGHYLSPVTAQPVGCGAKG
jgi:hypothetical protein